MKLLTTPELARRAFLRRGASLAATGVFAPWAMNLSLLADAAAAENPADYKALVCIFLLGGNDHGNTLVPVDAAHHASYAAIRGGLATPRDALAATTLTTDTALADGLQWALAPQMAALLPLWNDARLAVQLNVGPLIVPTTVAQYQARSVPLPPKLMSHNDQQSIWQSDLAEGATSGWGGRMGDLMLAANGGSMFTCVSISGNAVFLSGQQAVQYQLGTSGAVAIQGIQRALYGSSAAQAALQRLITADYSHLLAAEHARVTQRSITAEATISAALASVPEMATVFPGTSLGGQLKTVARMIAARASLGVSRQVYFVARGGFDLHDNLLANHPGLLTEVADAMRAFHDATAELGVAPQVTSFTASDFGRTLVSNGDGSDHGWGGHHLVLGGAVKGRRFYGQAPAIAVNGPDDIGQGRLLPSTSVDQFGATLASWFGVSDGAMASVMPHIGNFDQRQLGFV